MTPEPCQGAEKSDKEPSLSPVDQELVNAHLEPPVGTPKVPAAAACLQDTKPSSTPVVFSHNLQLAPESLAPRTLRLLWGQRELEIRALRWAVQNHQDARHCHILDEVAGLPPKRSSHSQERFLQNRVQKLTLELKEQKEQAQMEKSQLQERLRQAVNKVQHLEAAPRAFRRSCLLQLSHSSWAGREQRPSTGSVEVVTAETLMDASDLSENDQVASTGEGFRPENVDWNSIAQRYPSLLASIKSNSDPNSEQTEPHLRSVSREALARPEGLSLDPPWDQPGKGVLTRESCADSEHQQPRHRSCRHRHRGSPISCCLKIVAVSRKERFVRILNQSPEETADLGGLTLQQLLYGFPACMYRFPPGTLLAPRHYITVWGEGPGSTKKQPPSSLGQEPVHFRSSQGCVTLLLNPKGEVLSEHRASHCETPVSRISADSTHLSLDRSTLSEAGFGADPWEQRRGPQYSRTGRVPDTAARRRKPRTPGLLPRLSTSKLLCPREVPARPEAAETRTPELLPALPEAGLRLEPCGARKEHRVRVCRKRVDRGCPMVMLSVQSTAESRYGFRFLPCPPVTTDSGARV